MPYSDEEIEMFRNGSNPDMYPNTNWYDLVLDDLAVMTKHSVSVSGGNKVKYFTSLGYMYDDKFTPGASANRYNMTTNLSSDIPHGCLGVQTSNISKTQTIQKAEVLDIQNF